MDSPDNIRQLVASRPLLSVLTLIVCVAVASVTISLSVLTHVDIVRADTYRHLSLFVEPWLSGSFSIQQLWADHHPRPVYAILLIVNAVMFGLQASFDLWVGFSCLLLFLALVGFAFCHDAIRAGVGSNCHYVLLSLSLIAICATAFSMSSTIPYRWTLLTIGYFDFLVSLLPCLAFGRYARTRTRRTEYLTYALCVILLVINFDRGVLVCVSIAGLSLLAALVERDDRMAFARPVIVLIILFAMLQVFLVAMGNTQNSARFEQLGNLKRMLTQPLETVLFFGSGLSSSLLDESMISRWQPGETTLGVSKLFLLLVYTIPILLALYCRMWRGSAAALILALVPFPFMIAIYLFRIDFDAAGLGIEAAPRYRVTYHMGWVGVLWLYAMLALRGPGRPGLIIALGVSTCLILIHLSYARENWTQSAILVNNATTYRLNVLRFASGINAVLPDIMCPGGRKACQSQVRFLRDNGLGTFAPAHLREFSQACDSKLLDVSRFREQVIFTFDRDMGHLPVDIRAGTSASPLDIRSFGHQKILFKKLPERAGSLTLLCYNDGAFKPIVSCSSDDLSGCLTRASNSRGTDLCPDI